MKQTLTSMKSSIIKIININYNDNYNAHLQINIYYNDNLQTIKKNLEEIALYSNPIKTFFSEQK